MSEAPVPPRVHVVGTGLIGTSLGLALTRAGGSVTLEDISTTNAALARDLGAGETTPAPGGASGDEKPQLVVVATPPDVTAACVAAALERFPGAVVTDVASVKVAVIDVLRERGAVSVCHHVSTIGQRLPPMCS